MVPRRCIGRRLHSALLLGVSAWLSLLMAGCGGGQTRGHPLDSRWSDDDGSELAAFEHRWTMPRAPEIPSVILGVVNDHRIVGLTMGGPGRWRYDHALEGRPLIAGSVVVGMGDGELFALDAFTGEPHWTRKALGRLRGAGDDGDTTLVSIASLNDQRSIVLAVKRSGDVVRQLYERAVIGSPAVFDAFAFLPWDGNRVVIFDLLEGTEAARVVSREPISHAFLVSGELYFGETTAVRFDQQIVEARRGGGSRVTLPGRQWPGDPKWMLPGSQSLPTAASRDDRIRYYARPRSTATGPSVDDHALSYQRLVIGLQAPQGTTRWVHTNENTVLGGAAAEDSFALCDSGGEVRWLETSTGEQLHRVTLRERLVACVVQSERSPSVDRSRTEGAALADQIATALSTRDSRLLPIQLELMEDLTSIEGNAVTAQLIALASETDPSIAHRPDHRAHPRLAISLRALELLAARRSGTEAMLAALAADQAIREPRGNRSDAALGLPVADGLLDWGKPPQTPVGPLATALRAIGDPRAAPLLAPYLDTPSVSYADLAKVALALEQLATSAQIRPLMSFVARHHCNQSNPQLSRAVRAIGNGLVRLEQVELLAKIAPESCDRAATQKRWRTEVSGTKP